jgi:hypothetical protein
VGDDGHFELAGEPLRAPDGVHMNRSGAHVVWSRVRSQVLRTLGYAAPSRTCEQCLGSRTARSPHNKSSSSSLSSLSSRPAPVTRAQRIREERASGRKRGNVLLTDVR